MRKRGTQRKLGRVGTRDKTRDEGLMEGGIEKGRCQAPAG